MHRFKSPELKMLYYIKSKFLRILGLTRRIHTSPNALQDCSTSVWNSEISLSWFEVLILINFFKYLMFKLKSIYSDIYNPVANDFRLTWIFFFFLSSSIYFDLFYTDFLLVVLAVVFFLPKTGAQKWWQPLRNSWIFNGLYFL